MIQAENGARHTARKETSNWRRNSGPSIDLVHPKEMDTRRKKALAARLEATRGGGSNFPDLSIVRSFCAAF